MEREEQKLSLRERVKNIFKKYGWTLQAVALAVGIVAKCSCTGCYQRPLKQARKL